MSKLSDWMTKNKVDARRVVAISKDLEGHRREDRALKALRAKVKAGKAGDDEKEKAKQKPRSGKPVSTPTLEKAMRGATIPGPAKTRIIRAVNAILTQKKKGEVQLKDLF